MALNNRAFRERLALAREVNGLNISELGRRLKVTPQAAHAWEVGVNTPRQRRIEQIAALLDVSPTWLAYGEGEMRPTRYPDQATQPDKTDKTATTDQTAPGRQPLLAKLRGHLDASLAWDQALVRALPEPLQAHASTTLPSPWPKIRYLSPSLAAEVVRVPRAPAPASPVDRAIRQLLLVERLTRVSAGPPRNLLLVLTDQEAVEPPQLPAKLAWEIQALGIDIAFALTPEQAAAALAAAETPREE